MSGFAAVWFEPTDADKACKPFLSESWKSLSYTSPNLTELCTMNQTLGLSTPTGTDFEITLGENTFMFNAQL